MKTLQTDRLLLRAVQPGDAALYTLFADSKVMRFWLKGRTLSAPEVGDFLAGKSSEKDEYGASTVVEKSSQDVIGLTGIVPCYYLDTDDFEFGWGLVPRAWGKGYATEMSRAQLAHCFTALKLPRLLTLAHPDNTASWRVLEKLGMTLIDNVSTKDRGPRRVYCMKSDEFEATQ